MFEKSSSEKEIISILVSDTGAHIVGAPGKMKRRQLLIWEMWSRWAEINISW